jgi:hypothetical protein
VNENSLLSHQPSNRRGFTALDKVWYTFLGILSFCSVVTFPSFLVLLYRRCNMEKGQEFNPKYVWDVVWTMPVATLLSCGVVPLIVATLTRPGKDGEEAFFREYPYRESASPEPEPERRSQYT